MAFYYDDFNSFIKANGKKTADIIQEVAKAVPITYTPLHSSAPRRFPSNRKRTTHRIVSKTGLFNIEKWKQHKYHAFPDIVSIFIEARWRWTLVYCFLTYMSTWLIFAGIWWLILFYHGDFEDDHLPHSSNSTAWTPCVREIYGFTSTFLFSIEIHTTIGYGTRSLTLECPSAMFTMCMEGIVGTIMQSFIIGIVFAKLTRPKGRAQTLMFSKNALINQRDRHLCLMFRVGNIRKSRIISVNFQAYLLRHQTRQGDLLNGRQLKLDLLVDACNDNIFMFPFSVLHRIDENSPLYFVSAEDLLRSKLEILVVLEGTIESTGQPVQLLSSYINKEILWGHRFVNMIKFRHDKQGYEIDYSKFDETIQVNTPLCAASQLHEFYMDNIRYNYSKNSTHKHICCCGSCKNLVYAQDGPALYS
ncbi:unnamed protein product [Plutella xylostella]|uniref:(diamondback moth) hypothetical protein n=1 Tax=Plutella xylostella TaxID=51655 RepID=A0A8S4D7Q2_PLUXY|nr:unnamed protein product [Plutella xylostella]